MKNSVTTLNSFKVTKTKKWSIKLKKKVRLFVIIVNTKHVILNAKQTFCYECWFAGAHRHYYVK